MKLKATIARKILVAFALLGCLLVVGVEWKHYHTYGHLVAYGLHVDVLNEDFNIAIPGQTKMYWAEIFNFSLVPVQLPACRPSGDTLDPPLEYPYAIQRFNETSRAWQTIVDGTDGGFCLPPVRREMTGVVYTYLLPGSSVKVMSSEATGAREPFRKGDLARFVVFRKVSPNGEWETAITSVPFRIEDDVLREKDGSFRVQH
jgi:hypothetical protein